MFHISFAGQNARFPMVLSSHGWREVCDPFEGMGGPSHRKTMHSGA
ncbi:hypothetical protein ACFFHI_12740 [Streptomyces palmae]